MAKTDKTWQTLCLHNQNLCDQTRELLTHLEQPEAVHDVRVNCKKLRASWQLLRASQKPALCRQRNSMLGSLAAALAQSREQEVMTATLDKLTAGASGGEKMALYYARKRLLGVSGPDESASLVTAVPVAVMDDEARCWARLAVTSPGKEWWSSGYQRIHQRSCELAADACLEGHEDSYHQWRKWVKYELYACKALGLEVLTTGLKKKAAKQQTERLQALDALGSMLGNFHDLTDLRDRIQALEFNASKRPAWPDTVLAMLERLISEEKLQFAGWRHQWFVDA